MLLAEVEYAVLGDEMIDEPTQPDAPEDLDRVHLSQVRRWLAMPSGPDRAREVTEYIAWLDSCRTDASAFRDVDVYRMSTKDGYGYVRIGMALGLNRARGQQLVRKSTETHQAAAQRVAALRRKVVSVFGRTDN